MEKSSFFNSINGDRKYKAEDLASYFGSFISNGIFPNPGNNLRVIANNDMTVTLKPGKGWVNGYFYENTEDLILSIDPADGVLDRIDRVVLRLDYVNREIKASVKKGTFASSPVAPELQRDVEIYELGLADISIVHGAISIVSENITDTRLNLDLCGVTNSLITVDVGIITNQFSEDFDAWFETIKGALDGDVAGNLYNLIEQKVDIDLFNAHKAEKATDEKLGHVAVDGESIITNDAGVIFAHPIIDDTQHKPQIAISTFLQMCTVGYGGGIQTIAADDNYVYVGGTTTQTVKKLNKSNLSQVAESANYGGTIYAIAADDNYVYVGGTTTQTVKKLNKSNLSQVAESAKYGGTIQTIAVDDNYVYVGGTTTQTVKKLNKSNLSQVAESANYGGFIQTIATDDNYVYVGGTTTQTVKKLNKSNLSQVAESAKYGGTIYAIAADDNYVYVGGTTTQTVKKLNKSNLSQVAESANYGGTIYAIAADDNYVYVGGTTTQTVKKLNKSNLSQVAESANYGGTIYAIAADDNYVYVGGTTTQTVKKLNKSNLSQVAESANYGGDIYAIAADDNYVYVGGSTPQTVKKLNKSNLSQVAESADCGGDIRAIAADDNYVYVGGTTTQTVKKLVHIILIGYKEVT